MCLEVPKITKNVYVRCMHPAFTFPTFLLVRNKINFHSVVQMDRLLVCEETTIFTPVRAGGLVAKTEMWVSF